MTPSQAYQRLITKQKWQADPMQLRCLNLLDSHHYLIENHRKGAVGCYLYGPVGVGKSLCAKLFVEQLSVPYLRLHFHAFMQQVHQSLKLHQQQSDPLTLIAQGFSKKIRVLYLDEFMVTDIADAMILKTLCQALVQAGVYLIITANPSPETLYWQGHNRSSFLPFIAWCRTHLECLLFESQTDYRKNNKTTPTGLYWVTQEQDQMHQHFDHCALTPTRYEPISLLSRTVPIIQRSNKHIWFDFLALCAPPRCVKDYLALTKEYPNLWLSNVPILHRPNRIMLFIQLIDVLYEANTQLFIQAAAPPEQLCQCATLSTRFKRTISRLHALTQVID